MPATLSSIEWRAIPDGLEVRDLVTPCACRILVRLTTADHAVATANLPMLVRPAN